MVYDPLSIMHYSIERGETRGSTLMVSMNYELPTGDEEFLMALYPI